MPGDENYRQQKAADKIEAGVDHPNFCRLRFPNIRHRNCGPGEPDTRRDSQTKSVVHVGGLRLVQNVRHRSRGQ